MTTTTKSVETLLSLQSFFCGGGGGVDEFRINLMEIYIFNNKKKNQCVLCKVDIVDLKTSTKKKIQSKFNGIDDHHNVM
ncbi:hypothetical protein DERP_001104 [Dermatophagoides pteronyssinus]|uniref:Uncharacterized protein n=1 Tax=Dermatophagoides pteronyssinus TaxID=6956 RepID=A0ABQ8JDP2_DERPT|nr:hypothetical protein DERP_001104 [Dermatophagoides pteronyssinus]